MHMQSFVGRSLKQITLRNNVGSALSLNNFESSWYSGRTMDRKSSGLSCRRLGDTEPDVEKLALASKSRQGTRH